LLAIFHLLPEQLKREMSPEREVCDDLLNYSACIRADAELWSDGLAEERWVGLVCVHVCECECECVLLDGLGPAVHFMVASRQ